MKRVLLFTLFGTGVAVSFVAGQVSGIAEMIKTMFDKNPSITKLEAKFKNLKISISKTDDE